MATKDITVTIADGQKVLRVIRIAMPVDGSSKSLADDIIGTIIGTIHRDFAGLRSEETLPVEPMAPCPGCGGTDLLIKEKLVHCWACSCHWPRSLWNIRDTPPTVQLTEAPDAKN